MRREAAQARSHLGALELQGVSIEELISRCHQGEAAAWTEIVRRYERLVYAIPIRAGLSQDDAADIAQASFRILFESLQSIREPQNLGLWLMTVARRQVARLFSARATAVPQTTLDARAETTALEDDETEAFATAVLVHESVDQLHEPCRSLILALFFDPNEPSYDEVAAQIGRPVGSVGPLRGRCLVRLRKIMVAGGQHG